jgi:glyoxylase-like metal-dependent hydrolase (beta-lactamase superfamily II)
VTAPYTRGLHELGDGLFAFLQPDGSWGLSNAGLVTGEGGSLLIDTLFDLRLTREMLDAMAPLTATRPIQTLLNTHANGDHCWGNQLLPEGMEIVASAAAAEEMPELEPSFFAAIVAGAPGPVGDLLREIFGRFDFEGIELRLPTRTFSGAITLTVAGRRIELLELGPAHTRGDVIAYVPESRTVFTGDLLFIGGTPIMWAGPTSRWLAACEHIEGLDVDVVVPGHGPVTDREGPRMVRRYLSFVREAAAARQAAGMDAMEAALDIDLGEFADLGDSERLAVNVESIYRELDPGRPVRTPAEMIGAMVEYRARRRPAG